MKNKIIIPVLGGLVVTAGIFAALTINTDSASAQLSKEEAMEKVQTQFPGEVVEWELEKEGNKKVYEIEIQGTDRHYELEVDAETGDVLDMEEKRFSTNLDTKDKADETQNKRSIDGHDDDNNDYAENMTKNQNSILSVGEVEAIAHDLFDGRIEELELDEDDGVLYYEIEMYSATQEAEIEINAYTGELLSISKEKND